MLKWLKSKRGFTLVEVMVAFVIFAIMAAMVATILATINKTKQNNLATEREIEAQRNAYYLSAQDTEYDSGTDSLTFNFEGEDPISINYDVEDANPTGYEGLKLQYPVGNVNYDSLENPVEETEDDEKGGAGVTDRLDSRIYGDVNIDYVGVNLEKDTTYTGPGYRFLVHSTAKSVLYGNTTTNEYCWYSQYRIVFPSPILDYGYFQQDAATGEITVKGREEHNNAKAGVSIVSDIFSPARTANLIYDLQKDEDGNTVRGAVLLRGGIIRIASLVESSAATISQMHETNIDTRFYVVLQDDISVPKGTAEYTRWDINDVTTIFGTSGLGDTNGDGLVNKLDLEQMKDVDPDYAPGGSLDEFGDLYVYGHYNETKNGSTTIHKNVFGGYPNKDYVPDTP